MAELPASPLPEDPGYWDELARRIRDDATAPLARYRSARDDWLRLVARRAPWLVAASAAAMGILWIFVPASSASAALRWMERSLLPNETAGTLIGGPVPPSVHELMVQFPPAPGMEGEPR